jgi:biotin carboxylase
VLLIVPTGTYRAQDFLEAARSLGVEVVVASEEPHSLRGIMGERALQLPLSDPGAAASAIVEHDRLAPVDAVVAVDDQGTVAAAAAAQRLGLRHNPPAAAAAARDKLLMRRLLDAAEVPQPRFAPIAAGAGAGEVETSARTAGLPCVIKPTTLSASQGVLRADSLQEAVSVAARVRGIAADAGVSADAPLLVEQFVDGPEVAVEGLLTDGELAVLAVFDKPDPLVGPAFEETIYVTPSRLDRRDLDAVTDTTRAAALALGLRDGPVHCELRVSAGRATLIEIAGRTIGGLCSRALCFSTGATLEQLVICAALGLPVPSTELAETAAGVLMVPAPREGTLVSVDGTALALGVPCITDVQITVRPGRRVRPAPEGDRYLGFVFARAKTPAAAERALRRAWDLLDVQVASPD